MEDTNTKWLGKISILASLMLFVLVLIGIYVLEPMSLTWEWLIPLIPFIVITGFFIFLVSASLFVYGIYLLIV